MTHIGVLRTADPGSPEARSSFADIDLASDRLQRLVVQLLALARADNASPTELSFSLGDANTFAASIAEDHAHAAIARGIELRFDRSPRRATIYTHDLLAAELLGNLIDNAIRYSHDGGTIAIMVEAGNQGTDVIIEDDGPGIAPEDRHARADAVLAPRSRCPA